MSRIFPSLAFSRSSWTSLRSLSGSRQPKNGNGPLPRGWPIRVFPPPFCKSKEACHSVSKCIFAGAHQLARRDGGRVAIIAEPIRRELLRCADHVASIYNFLHFFPCPFLRARSSDGDGRFVESRSTLLGKMAFIPRLNLRGATAGQGETVKLGPRLRLFIPGPSVPGNPFQAPICSTISPGWHGDFDQTRGTPCRSTWGVSVTSPRKVFVCNRQRLPV